LRCSSGADQRLNPDPLQLPDAHIIIAPVVKAGRLRVRVPGHLLRDLDTPAVRQVVRNPGRAESVTAYRGFNARIGSAAAHHVPDIGARYRPRPEFLGFADGSAEQRPLALT